MTTSAATRPSRLMDRIDQAISIKYNNLVYELKATGHDIITLSLGEAFFDIPAPDFGGFDVAELHHYSHSRGIPELRRRLAKYYEDRFGPSVDPDQEMIITAGSKAAIYMTLLAVLEPGDEVVIPEPFWLSYPAHVRLCRGEPVMVPHQESLFDLERHVTARTRAIIINNPNNPTGRVYTAAELDHLHALADRRGLLLLVDEAYNEFVVPGTAFVSAAVGDPDRLHTVTINSMSKNFGISGWRIGYLIAHRQLIDEVLKLNQHLVTCAPTILANYLASRFDELIERTRPQIQRTVAMRNTAAGWLAEEGIDTLPGEATFYLFGSLGESGLGSDAFATRLLRERGVCVVPGIAYGESCDRHIRISVGTESPERTRRGIAAIRSLIDTTRA
jgi:aspartate/methionine/tyrosine aminotransferase